MEENDPILPEFRWNVAQRLEFIEFRLLWEGRINRSDVAERFGMTLQQATQDLGLYEQTAPENIIYDRNAKTFVPSREFRPKFLRDYADRQLLQLAAISAGLVTTEETWFGQLPPASVIPVPQRHVPALTMRWILEAIRTNSLIEIEYQSVKQPETVWRSIGPHALGHNGERWHARAWCPKRKSFRDFVLSRISNVGALAPNSVDPAMDHEWFNEVELHLAPNPALSEGARRSLSKEYNMVRGRLRLKTRAALAFYMIQHFNLDLDLEPPRKQLVLTNRDEVDEACRIAREETERAVGEAGLA
jgi:predicted DNA-binding transcriptional regulator YafY